MFGHNFASIDAVAADQSNIQIKVKADRLVDLDLNVHIGCIVRTYMYMPKTGGTLSTNIRKSVRRSLSVSDSQIHRDTNRINQHNRLSISIAITNAH